MSSHGVDHAGRGYLTLTIEQVITERRRSGGRVFPVRLRQPVERTRAEPVAMPYEQGRIVHVRPFPDLED